MFGTTRRIERTRNNDGFLIHRSLLGSIHPQIPQNWLLCTLTEIDYLGIRALFRNSGNNLPFNSHHVPLSP